MSSHQELLEFQMILQSTMCIFAGSFCYLDSMNKLWTCTKTLGNKDEGLVQAILPQKCCPAHIIVGCEVQFCHFLPWTSFLLPLSYFPTKNSHVTDVLWHLMCLENKTKMYCNLFFKVLKNFLRS